MDRVECNCSKGSKRLFQAHLTVDPNPLPSSCDWQNTWGSIGTRYSLALAGFLDSRCGGRVKCRVLFGLLHPGL